MFSYVDESEEELYERARGSQRNARQRRQPHLDEYGRRPGFRRRSSDFRGRNDYYDDRGRNNYYDDRGRNKYYDDYDDRYGDYGRNERGRRNSSRIYQENEDDFSIIPGPARGLLNAARKRNNGMKPIVCKNVQYDSATLAGTYLDLNTGAEKEF